MAWPDTLIHHHRLCSYPQIAAAVPCRAKFRTPTPWNSPMIKPEHLAPYAAVTNSVQYGTPRIAVASAVTGKIVEAGQSDMSNGVFWCDQATKPLQFYPGLMECEKACCPNG